MENTYILPNASIMVCDINEGHLVVSNGKAHKVTEKRNVPSGTQGAGSVVLVIEGLGTRKYVRYAKLPVLLP